MKMTSADYDALKSMIQETLPPKVLGEEKQIYAENYWSDRRFRFDLLYAIPQTLRQAWFDRGIYAYLDDDHIHTALKKILA